MLEGGQQSRKREIWRTQHCSTHLILLLCAQALWARNRHCPLKERRAPRFRLFWHIAGLQEQLPRCRREASRCRSFGFFEGVPICGCKDLGSVIINRIVVCPRRRLRGFDVIGCQHGTGRICFGEAIFGIRRHGEILRSPTSLFLVRLH